MVELTFPQPGDLPDAAYFAFATGRARSGIISGLTFAADFTVPEVTIDPGKAVIDRGDMTTAHPNIDPAETVSDAVAVVDSLPVPDPTARASICPDTAPMSRSPTTSSPLSVIVVMDA